MFGVENVTGVRPFCARNVPQYANWLIIYFLNGCRVQFAWKRKFNYTFSAIQTAVSAVSSFQSEVDVESLGPSTPDLNLSLVSHSVYKW